MGYVVQLACPGTIQSAYGTGCGCMALPVVMMLSLYGICYRIQEIHRSRGTFWGALLQYVGGFFAHYFGYYTACKPVHSDDNGVMFFV